MADPYFDNKGQFDRIVSYLIPNETIWAVFDCKGAGTGFVGFTDRRVIYFDQSGILIKHKVMTSIPYNQIVKVSSTDEGMIFKTGEIYVYTASSPIPMIFEFRGSDKAHKAYQYIMFQILKQ